MSTSDRLLRERTARRRLIIETARLLAEREGWDAVTTRRLSTEIEYSQPVIYKHFASMDDLMVAVALEGFSELAIALGEARRQGPANSSLSRVALAFGTFASMNPALYDAMFSRTIGLRFGTSQSLTPLSAAFGELHRAVSDSISTSGDTETLTEVVWASLHGLITLARSERLRPGLDEERVRLLLALFEGTTAAN